jgi:apolipoprotein N-acyltransferase
MHRYGGLPALAGGRGGGHAVGALSLYLAAAMRRPGAAGAAAAPSTRCCSPRVWLLAELARGADLHRLPLGGQRLRAGRRAAGRRWRPGWACTASARAGGAGGAAGAWPHGPRPRPRTGPALAGAVLAAAAPWLGPGTHTAAGRSLSVQLLQPNVAQDEKFAARAHARHAAVGGRPAAGQPRRPGGGPGNRRAAAAGHLELRPRLLARAAAALRPGWQAALVGVPLGDFDRGYTNSVAGLSAAPPARARRLPLRQDHLVPFGEFIPPAFAGSPS